MAWDEWRWWWGDRETILRERAESLEAEVSYQAAAHRRMASRLSELEGSLEARVSRMAAAFDAFVELSDLRVELALHAPAAVARQRVRRVLVAIGALGDGTGPSGPPGSPGPPPPPPEDVPGYWVVPAGLLVAGVAGYRLLRSFDDPRQARSTVEYEMSAAERQLAQANQELAEARAEATRAAESARRARVTMSELMA